MVVGETAEAVEAAKALISVDYEELTPIRNAYEAMAKGAEELHEGGNLLAHKHVSRGDAAGAIAKSKHILHGKYTTPFTEHAFLEPECAVAIPFNGGVKIYSSDQSVYDTQHETAPMLGLPMGKDIC